MKKTMTAALAAAFIFGSAPLATAADSYNVAPISYQKAAEDYMSQRLSDPRSARYNVRGEPYEVRVNLRGGQNVAAWAVDIMVKSRLPNGSWSNYQPYTVIFQNGAAVALKSDLAKVVPI